MSITPTRVFFGGFELSDDPPSLSCDGRLVGLCRDDTRLLWLLVERRDGAPMPRRELLAALSAELGERAPAFDLLARVGLINQVLQPSPAHYVAHLPGRGYRFVGPVRTG